MTDKPQKAFVPTILTAGLFGFLTYKTYPFAMQGIVDFYALIPCMTGLVTFTSLADVVGIGHYHLRNTALRIQARQPTTQKGSAAWASPQEITNAGLRQSTGVFLGCDESGQPVFYEGEGHGLVLAPAGMGKTTGFVLCNLLHSQYSIICTDLKGTLSAITKRARENHFKQRCFAVNPGRINTDILGEPARYNPLMILCEAWADSPKDCISDAQNIALQLLPEPKQAGENIYFRNGSRKLLVFAFLYLVTQGDTDNATLCAALSLLQNTENLKDALYVTSCSDALSGDLASLANDLLPKFQMDDQRQAESFREGATQALNVFSPSGYLAESVSACDFRFKDLKERPTTIYLVADPSRAKIYEPWIGLLNWCALTELTRTRKNKPPVIFMLDEATNYKISDLSTALTGLREYGIRLFFVIQELEEYARIYGKEALETLLSQTSFKQIMGTRSQKTLEWISKQLGETTVKTDNYNLGHSYSDPVKLSTGETSRRLLNPDEVRRFEQMILLIDAIPPISARNIGYNEVNPWAKRAGINPLYGKKFKGEIRFKVRY